MTYLTSNQLKQYEDEGFVSPINIFSKDSSLGINKLIGKNFMINFNREFAFG